MTNKIYTNVEELKEAIKDYIANKPDSTLNLCDEPLFDNDESVQINYKIHTPIYDSICYILGEYNKLSKRFYYFSSIFSLIMLVILLLDLSYWDIISVPIWLYNIIYAVKRLREL